MRPPPSASPLSPSVSPDRLELLPSECQCAPRRASLSECALANEDDVMEEEQDDSQEQGDSEERARLRNFSATSNTLIGRFASYLRVHTGAPASAYSGRPHLPVAPQPPPVRCPHGKPEPLVPRQVAAAHIMIGAA